MTLEWLGYIEFIETFVFREKASISIPKERRKRAFSLQVDVEIVSTDGRDYANAKSIPEYSFYGYAVLVFRDHSKVQIAIEQPRQRLYYGRVGEAYTNWYQLFLWRAWREYSRGLAEVIGAIGQQVGLGVYVVPPAPCLPWSGFEELPLRELYIKTRFGTQFNLEISRWQPKERSGDTDCDYSPESNQVDDSEPDGTGKDDGLPPLGVLPQKASDSSNPYGGLPLPSTNNELGDYGNNKINSVNFANPDNAPTSPDILYYVVALYLESYQSGCGNPKTRNLFAFSVPLTEVPTIAFGQTLLNYTSCNNEAGVQRQVLVNGSVSGGAADGLVSGMSLSIHVTNRADGDPDFFYGNRAI